MFWYPLLPTISEPTLSPIQEETEDILLTLTPDVISDRTEMAEDPSIVEQRNNNTPYENEAMDLSKTNDSFRREDVMGASGSPEITAADFPRAITVPRNAYDQRGDVETVRKPESEVEVLKQKYINNDIQDIPSSSLEGPIRYGRLHRSRSLHVNRVSQDIRSQMNKLRLKQGLGNFTTSPRVKFRCSSLTYDSQHGSKTLEEFLNGDSLNDDYDPELAKLFDDYVEECDQITRGNFTTDTAVLRRLGAIRDPKQATPNDTETCEAFWRGFAQGMSYSKHHHSDDSNALDLAIKMADAPREVIQDPCIDKSSQSDMIRTNQDITHKFLKEWEDQHSDNIINKDGGRAGNDSELTCFARNTETKMLNDLLEQKPEVGPISTQSNENNPTSETKLVVQRDALHLGKTNIALKLTCHKENPKARVSFPTFQNDKCDGGKNDVKEKDGTSHIPTEKNVQFDDKDVCKKTRAPLPTTSKKKARNGSLDDKCTCRSPGRKGEKRPISKDQPRSGNSTANGPAGPFMIVRKDGSAVGERSTSRSERTSRHERESKDDSATDDKNQIKKENTIRIKNALDDTVFKEYQFNDENISIITLAKMKLENKSMSSLGLDDVLMPKRDQIPRCRSEELEREKEHVMMRKILSNLDLGGWESKTKPYCDQDTLHVSSSELLHPVNSLESFPSPSLWRQSSSTPLLTSLEKKHRRITSNEHTPTASRTMTPDRCVSTSAKLLDLDDTAITRRKYETSAFKPNNNVLKNKIPERIKLRLTKSCDSFVEKGGRYRDPAFANIPLARCQSYNIEQKMKSGLTHASSINLSESLAKQLKDLGKDKDKHKRITFKEKDFHDDDDKLSDVKTSTDDQCTFQSKSSLPLLDGKKLLTLSPRNAQDKQSPRISLPEIGIRKVLGNQQSKSQNESLNNDEEVRNQTLPPISCTSLLASETPIDNDKTVSDNHTGKILNHDEDSKLLMNKSFPCRTESLQTPYTFDTADPSKFLLRAKALPSLHTVCTSCGGINEKHQNTSGNEKPSPRGLFRAGKDKNIHHRCVTPSNEEKWKLEKSRPNSGNELPKIGVSNSAGSKKHNKGMKETRVNKTISNDYSKCERTKKPHNDEMTFKFLDQNITLRFEVDLPTEDKRKLLNSISNASDSSTPRPSNFTQPCYQDNVEGSITRETKIYKDKIRQKLLLQDGEHGRTNSPVSSPYLEHCKRKSYLQSLKESRQRKQYVDLHQGAVEESPYRSGRLTKRFPVIQAKTNKESTKKGSRVSSKHGKSQKVNSVKQKDIKKRDLCVEPGKLPTINQQSPRSEEKKHFKKQLTKELRDARGQIERKKELLPNITDTIKVTVDSTVLVPQTNTINNDVNDM